MLWWYLNFTSFSSFFHNQDESLKQNEETYLFFKMSVIWYDIKSRVRRISMKCYFIRLSPYFIPLPLSSPKYQIYFTAMNGIFKYFSCLSSYYILKPDKEL